MLAEPWLLSFLVLCVPHKCKVTYSLNFCSLQLQLPMPFVFKAHMSANMKTKVKGHVKGDLLAYGALTSTCRNKSVRLSGFLLLESSGSGGVCTSPKDTASG